MTGYLEESEGNKSTMRLMSLMMAIATICSGFITILSVAPDKTAGLYITGLFAVAAFCPKALQKFMEAKV
jgi:hypothetical protein